MVFNLKPSLEEVQAMVAADQGNTIPIYAELEADFLTPVSAYLKVADRCDYSFLLESVAGGETIGRYSFIGAEPYKLIQVGKGLDVEGDPLTAIEKELAPVRYVKVPGLPSFTGGAVGYIGFDCFQYFEPSIKGELADPIGIPDAIFMLCDTLVVFDRVRHIVNVVSHYRSDVKDPEAVKREYMKAAEEIETTLTLLNEEHIPKVPQGPIQLGHEAKSNVGKEGYMNFVKTLKHHIKEGDIFQAVPSQRLARPTSLHPFNVYRHLRSLNPSPYMFYVNLKDFQIVGASPEMLTKIQDRIAYTHPIAGTRKRGKTPQEDQALADDLLSDPKERAEHVMLVDLGRNDVNRVCKPETVKVDKLMQIEYYSHVMHIVSNVSGELRDDKTPFDAFRAIFPAGTVSGAPKIKAIELIRGLEKEKRGVYAGSVGHFDYSGDLDTCIAIRTMLFKEGVAYLQAGGGIVFDSVEEDEYQETMNKMGSNLATIEQCEQKIYEQQQQQGKV
ncbi:anthranilate synthase component I [Radiomyces spectabilis]|uniref:anthranilate synthase component I n=1 Tax=Radiomyces spectabilis TaxID=64574 RepID=UPI00221F6960|nr:anthranilate synthase component I [Radiomyces spectabilis]KAI8364764.1 anthranilate synthase component I [Radiomyces spectabilis]